MAGRKGVQRGTGDRQLQRGKQNTHLTAHSTFQKRRLWLDINPEASNLLQQTCEASDMREGGEGGRAEVGCQAYR